MSNKEQILEELKKEFYLIFALDELKKIDFDIDKVWAWIEEQALSKFQQATIEEIEDILENKVKVYSKFNFCKKCQEQPTLKDNMLIMYVEKELDKAIDKLKK